MKRLKLSALIIFCLAFVALITNTYSYEKMLKGKGSQFCFLCHSDKKEVYLKNGHGKFKVQCQNCHNPHGQGNSYMLKAEEKIFCLTCHTDKKEHFESDGHGKFQVTCQSCHDPHGTKDETEEPTAPTTKEDTTKPSGGK